MYGYRLILNKTIQLLAAAFVFVLARRTRTTFVRARTLKSSCLRHRRCIMFLFRLLHLLLHYHHLPVIVLHVQEEQRVITLWQHRSSLATTLLGVVAPASFILHVPLNTTLAHHCTGAATWRINCGWNKVREFLHPSRLYRLSITLLAEICRHCWLMSPYPIGNVRMTALMRAERAKNTRIFVREVLITRIPKRRCTQWKRRG